MTDLVDRLRANRVYAATGHHKRHADQQGWREARND
jgi:hypothetical protein